MTQPPDSPTPTPPIDPVPSPAGAPLSPGNKPSGGGINSVTTIWAGIISLICGGASILTLVPGMCCCLFSMLSPPLSIAGIVFGIFGMNYSKNMAQAKNVPALIGILLSALGLLFFIVLLILKFIWNVAVFGASNGWTSR